MPTNSRPRMLIMAGAAVAVIALAIWWLQRDTGLAPTPSLAPSKASPTGSQALRTPIGPAPEAAVPDVPPMQGPANAGTSRAPTTDPRTHPVPAPSPLPPVIDRRPPAEGEGEGEVIPPVTRSHSLGPELEKVHQDLVASARLLAGLVR